MAPFRIAIAGLALALVAALPLSSILRRGRFRPRGPWPAVNRRERPVRFWTKIAGHMGGAVNRQARVAMLVGLAAVMALMAESVTPQRACAAAAAKLSPAALHQEIRERGAKAVVARLWRAPDQPHQGWLGFEQRVASGAPEWLSVAEELADATDAGQTHGLSIALHHALSKNPQGVLRLLPHPPFTIEAVCANGNDEEAAEAEARELRAILAAVSRVKAPSLRNVRDRCLKALHETLRLTLPRRLPAAGLAPTASSGPDGEATRRT